MLIALIALMGSADAAKADKVDVCHNDDDGYHIINVSENAVDKHISNHGDWEVVDEVCGDGLDNDCDGEIDEDCCPCADYWPSDLSSYADDGYYVCWQDIDQSPDYTDVSLFNAYDPETGSTVYGYAVDWGSVYENDYGYTDAECYAYSEDVGDTTFALTAEEAAQCGDVIDALTSAAGMVCETN